MCSDKGQHWQEPSFGPVPAHVPVPEHLCFAALEAASAAGEGTPGPQASTQTLESFRLLPSPSW